MRGRRSNSEMKVVAAVAKRPARGEQGARRSASAWKKLCKRARKWWASAVKAACSVRVTPRARRLKVCESISLGEKRVVAVVQFEHRRYLVGACGTSMSLLSELPPENSFALALENFAAPEAKVAL